MGGAAIWSRVMARGLTRCLLVGAGWALSAGTAFAAMSMAKSFSPAQVSAGQTSVLTITVASTETSAVTGFAVTDNLPSGVQLAATPQAQSTCGGGNNATAGAPVISFSGATVPIGGSCDFKVTVVALQSAAGTTVTNSIPLNAVSNDQGIVPTTQSAGVAAQASLTVLGTGTFLMQKMFYQWNATTGNGTNYTGTTSYETYRGKTFGLWIYIRNPNNYDLTNFTLSDAMPSGVVLTGGAPISNQCGLTINTSDPNTLKVTGGRVPANPAQDWLKDCLFQVPVTSSASAVDGSPYVNTIAGADVSNAQNAQLSNVPKSQVTFVPPSFGINKTMTVDNSMYVTSGRTLVKVEVIMSGAGSRINMVSATDPIRAPGILLADGATATLVAGGTKSLTRTTTCAGQTLTGAAGATSLVLSGGDIPESSNTSGVYNVPGYCLATFWVEVDGCENYANRIDAASVSATITVNGRQEDLPAAQIRVPNYDAVIYGSELTGSLFVYQNYYGGVASYVNGSWTGTPPPIAPVGTTGPASIVFRNTSSSTYTGVTYSKTFPTQSNGTTSGNNLVLAPNPLGGANYSLTCYGNDGKATTPISGASAPVLTMTTPWAAGGITMAFRIDHIPPHAGCRVDFYQTAQEPTLAAPPPYPDRYTPMFSANPGALSYTRSPNTNVCVPPVQNGWASYRISKDYQITKKFIAKGATPGYQEDNSTPAISSVRVGVPFSMVIGFPSFTGYPGSVRTGITFTDTLPDGLVIAPTPNVRGFCLGPETSPNSSGFPIYDSIIADPGSNTFTVNKLTPIYLRDTFMDCGVVVDVMATRPSDVVNGQPVPFTNTIAARAVSSRPLQPLGPRGPNNVGTVDFHNASAVSASVVALAPLVQGSKTFSPIAVPFGTSTRLQIRVSTSELTVSGVTITDKLPDGMVVAAGTAPGYAPPSNTCGGTLTARPGSDTLQLQGGTIATGLRECVVEVSVDMHAPGTYVNTIPIGGVMTAIGGNGQPLSASATSLPRLMVAKTFDPPQIVSGYASRATVTVTNPEVAAQAAMKLSDTLPAGLSLVNLAGASTTCTNAQGSPVPVLLSGGTVGLNGFRLEAGASCSVSFDVSASVTAQTTFTNVIVKGGVSSDASAGGSGSSNQIPAQADLVVLALGGPPSVVKAFSPPQIISGGSSRVTIAVTNPQIIRLSALKLTDPLPAGLLPTVPANASTTCQHAGTPVPVTVAGTTVSLQGFELAPGASCTVSFDVTAHATEKTTYTNVIAAGGLMSDPASGGSGAVNTVPAQADLVIEPVGPLSVVKAFNPSRIEPNTKSRATITVSNPASAQQSGIKVTDSLPADLKLAAPPNAQTTCTDVNGVAVKVDATGTTVSAAGIKLEASGSCSISFDVTTDKLGTYTNVIAIGGVVSDPAVPGGTGSSNTVEAKADLVVDNSTPPTPIPTLGWPMLWLLASLLGWSGMRLRGRRG